MWVLQASGVVQGQRSLAYWSEPEVENALERESKDGFREGVVRIEGLNEGHGLRGGNVLPAEAEDARNSAVDDVVHGAARGKDLIRLRVVGDRDTVLDEGSGCRS